MVVLWQPPNLPAAKFGSYARAHAPIYGGYWEVTIGDLHLDPLGVLVVLYGLAGLLVGGIVGNAAGLSSRQRITIGICEVLAAIALWFTGVRLNRDTERRLVDPKTGQGVIIRRRHTLFWIPMQYWAPVLALIGVIVLISGFRQ